MGEEVRVNVNELIGRIELLEKKIKIGKEVRPYIGANVNELIDRVESLEKKVDFMTKRIYNITREEVQEKFKEQGFIDFLVHLTKRHLHSKFDDLIKEVVKETVNSLNSNLKAELKISKNLASSIDSEIKHFIRSNDFSYETDRIVCRKIEKHVEDFFNNLNNMHVDERKSRLLQWDESDE